MEPDALSESLELVAERAGDPTEAIYRRLFADFPELEPLFWRDADGAIRGEMLHMALRCLMDPDGPYQANLVRAERTNHDGFGVPPAAFDRFLPIIMETCRDLLADAWTADMEAAWAERLAALAA